jgi:hypothetical protein
MFKKQPQVQAAPPRPERAEPKNPPILYERTQRVISQIEEKLGERLITYWNSPSGSICSNDVIGLYGILRRRVARINDAQAPQPVGESWGPFFIGWKRRNGPANAYSRTQGALEGASSEE